MDALKKKGARAFRRRMRVRNRIRASRAPKTRLSVHKTTKHIYVQLINDNDGRTLAAASTLSKDIRDQVTNGGNIEAAKVVGQMIGKKAAEAGVSEVAFDRGSFRYHGRVKALADAAREAGLKF